MRKALFLAVLTATAVTTALCAKQPETVSGIAKVVDGDSLEIGTARIRLFGIDAPEGRQLCTRDSTSWPCGTAAADKLRALIGGESIDCVQRDVDKYQRIVAVCKKGPADLGAAMVKAGLALAYRQYSEDYVDEEDDARRAKRGMWAGEFTATAGTIGTRRPAGARASRVSVSARGRAATSSSPGAEVAQHLARIAALYDLSLGEDEDSLAKSRAKSSSWEVKSSARPAWRGREGLASSSRRAGSSEAVGSSSKSSGGSMARARAIATRCASPPESSRGSSAARCPTPS